MYVSASVTHIAALVGPNYRNNVIHFGNDNELKSGLLKISTKPPRVQYSYDAQLSIGGLRKHLAFKNRAGGYGKEQMRWDSFDLGLVRMARADHAHTVALATRGHFAQRSTLYFKSRHPCFAHGLYVHVVALTDEGLGGRCLLLFGRISRAA